MAYIRKAGAGSASLGYTWERPGAVVEVDDAHVPELLAIPHNDFTVVDAPEQSEPEPEKEIKEPAPAAEVSEAPAAPKRGRGARGKAAEADAGTGGDTAAVEE